jgi:nucleotide-binding universal stress UspA family protein
MEKEKLDMKGRSSLDQGAPKVVLAATDFSATASRAVRWAAGLARSTGASLELVHVVPPLQEGLEVSLPQDVTSMLVEAAKHRLEGIAEDLLEAGAAPRLHVLAGRPVEQILELSESRRPLVLVVGTRGLSGMRHLLLGSTAERLVQRSRQPVLCIHPEDRTVPDSVTRILVPTDFSADAEHAARAALELFGLHPGAARLTLFHAHQLLQDFGVYGYDPGGVFLNSRELLGRTAARRLEERAVELRQRGLEVDTVIREGSAAEEIVAEVASGAYDVIAMGTRGRGGLRHLVLGSVAERVVQRAACPVLTVRLSSAAAPVAEDEEAGALDVA